MIKTPRLLRDACSQKLPSPFPWVQSVRIMSADESVREPIDALEVNGGPETRPCYCVLAFLVQVDNRFRLLVCMAGAWPFYQLGTIGH